MKGDIFMALGRLVDFLDNIGPNINDVLFFDKDDVLLTEDDLKKLDFDNLVVLDSDIEDEYGDGERESDKWIIANLTLDVKKSS